MQLTAAQLAKHLSVSRARVSQYVSEGKLDGCYTGDGRDRRFDLTAVTGALQRKLDKGQMMGNGATTRRALQDLPQRLSAPVQRESAPLLPGDMDRYELARTVKVEEEARSARRRNAEAEGTMVLASAAAQQTSRLIAQEIAEMEAMLRDAARDVADTLAVDYKTVRKLLMDRWRSHRGSRAAQLQAQADTATLSDEEQAQDF